MEATPTQMRLHATRKNLAPSALDREPRTSALDSSSSFPFIAPLRLRWSPVVSPRKTPSISFPFLSLRDSFFHNDRGTPTPTVFSLSQESPKALPIPLTPVLSYSCALFCVMDSFNRFRFNYFRTLCKKHRGWVYPLEFFSCFQGLADSSFAERSTHPLHPSGFSQMDFAPCLGAPVARAVESYPATVGRWGRRSRWGGRAKYAGPRRRPGLRGWCSPRPKRWRCRRASRREWSG
jgi:hypothetical protein